MPSLSSIGRFAGAALYMMAYDAREPNAVHRLMAGYADRGSDAGMAFWWAAKNPVRDRFPAQCIPKANPEADPDGFNGELERMPPAVFAACSYLFAVVGTVSVQSEYPPLALYHGVSGSVAMEFDPASGRIAWRQQDVNMAERPTRMVRDLAREELDDPRKIRDSLVSYMKARGDAALARHRKPLPALDPDYVYRTTFVFDLHAD
ncbi:hypothetical protein HH212_19840 [Massilia forsythiae]|uniref:Uncharacterized protein n=1 Tax=Massilia forsythiae TaxID=2728020 RepID=A0A7Z2ZU69_9BURK|nr:hypothetical protein [Massilia forsythiae]QJE01990.1 hypothetical protein HH212_19840 [Massilia forsythiae]